MTTKASAEGERERERSQAHNDSERIVTLPLVARETEVIMRLGLVRLGLRYDSRKMSTSDRIGNGVSGD